MKACLYWVLLLVARIVAAAELDSKFVPDCLYVVEGADVVTGIYAYKQPLEVIQGYPTMQLVAKTLVPGKKNYTFDRNVTSQDVTLSWNNLGHTETWEFRFDKPGNKYRIQLWTHVCRRVYLEGTDQERSWIVYDEVIGRYVGWSMLLKDSSTTACNPDPGSLSLVDASGDGVPFAGVFAWKRKFVSDCYADMKKWELATGKVSYATAISLNGDTQTCMYWHQPHNALQLHPKELRDYASVCFLEETADLPTSPDLSLYPICQLYLHDPKFAGLWQHDFASYYKNNQPYLKKRKITMDITGSPVVTLHDGFEDGFSGYYDGAAMVFKHEDGTTLTLDTILNVCYRDWEINFEFLGTNSERGILTRYDAGLGCGPFYGSWDLPTSSSFMGFSTEYLESQSSLTKCHDHSSNLHPYGQWKAIISTLQHTDLGYGPCIAYGGGLDLSTLTFSQKSLTYSCISFESPVMTPVDSCRYIVEAGKYTGEYKINVFYDNNYSKYPSLKKVTGVDDEGVQVLSDTIGLMWEEDGYYLVGLDEKWHVDLGDVNICLELVDSSVKDVSLEADVKGMMYRYDPDNDCIPVQEYRWADNFHGYIVIQEFWSLVHCKAFAIVDNPGMRFKAFVRNGDTCWAFGEGLNLEDFVTKDIEMSDAYYSCVDKEYQHLLPVEPNESSCQISIVGTETYDGTYIADSSYDNVLNSYPELRRYPLRFSDGVATQTVSDGHISFIRLMNTYNFLRITIDPDPVTGVSPGIVGIYVERHICEEEYGFEKSLGRSSRAVARGMMTVIDPTSDFCHVIDGVYEVPDYTAVTTIFPHHGSFEECKTQANIMAHHNKWKALVIYGSVCLAFDMTMPSEKFVKDPAVSGRTCIFIDNFNSNSSGS